MHTTEGIEITKVTNHYLCLVVSLDGSYNEEIQQD